MATPNQPSSNGGGFKLKLKLGGGGGGGGALGSTTTLSSSSASITSSVAPIAPIQSSSSSTITPSVIKLSAPSVTFVNRAGLTAAAGTSTTNVSGNAFTSHVSPLIKPTSKPLPVPTTVHHHRRSSSMSSDVSASSEASDASSSIASTSRLPPVIPSFSSTTSTTVKRLPPVKERDVEHEHKLEKEHRGVSTAKYRKLKRSFNEAIESRDEASYALHRSQKIIARLQHEKRSLLDRVHLLESSAGLFPASLDPQQSHSLLDRPELPSLEDRPREMPILTTATDITNHTYSEPIEPALPPKDFAPRRRSKHLITHLAAQRIKESEEAKLKIKALPDPNYALINLLGIEGSEIAENVTRALAGEKVGVVQVVVAAPTTSSSSKENKRKRDYNGNHVGSAGGSSSSKSKSTTTTTADRPPKSHENLNALPNPFNGSGPSTMYASNESPKVDIEMDEPVSPAFSRTGADDSENDDSFDTKPTPSSTPVTKKPAQKKAKRQKSSLVTTGVHTIPHVPRYADGTPILPLPFGTMILRNLGLVDHRDSYHSERYIFPVGYEAVRKYPSMIDDKSTVEYVCKIVEGENGSIQFEVHPEDQPGTIISGTTATSAWSQIVKTVNVNRNRNQSNSVSGPDYFGLSHNVVKALVQELPGANEVGGYIWQQFVEDPDPALKNSTTQSGGSRKSSVITTSQNQNRIPIMTPNEFTDTHPNQNPSSLSPILFAQPPSQSTNNYDPYSQPSYHPHHHSINSLLHSTSSDPYSLPTHSSSTNPSTSNSNASYYTDPYAIPSTSAYGSNHSTNENDTWGVDPSLDHHHHHHGFVDPSLDPAFAPSSVVGNSAVGGTGAGVGNGRSANDDPYGLPPPNF